MEDRAYTEGHNAYHDGYRLKNNPYKRFSEDWEGWRMGWNDEMSDDPYWEKVRAIKKKETLRLNRAAHHRPQ